MEVHFFEGIEKKIDRDSLVKAMKMGELEDEDLELLDEMIENAAAVAKPKAVVISAEIDEIGADHICVNGIRLSSELVAEKTEHCRNVYPYSMTCGRELRDAMQCYKDDILTMIAADALQELYLREIIKKTSSEIKQLYFKGMDMSSIAPGSLEAKWSITEQKQLFAILGDNAEKIGVSLTDSCLMLPEKSVSGFFFSSDEHFENCMLCTRTDCDHRRAKYKG